MKKNFYSILLLLFAITGCASYTITPQNITRYDKGVEILDSIKPSSKVQIEISQSHLGGISHPPLVVYVGAQILEGNEVILDTDNISASQNNQPLPILTYAQILKSSYDFSDILQDFGIPTPPSSVSTTNIITPIFYYGRGGFLAYNMLFNPFLIDDSQTQQMIQEQREARKIMATNYLRKTTLSVEIKAKGGFIAIDTKKIHTGTLELKVSLGKDVHRFDINIQKN
ncbi:hypothetical protein BKH46_04705 [Helicobacter sp. 12S02634-8]|uniref:hypothetical protein n=1 Tax=Helicobacter sp. 12S02634-8 TaxID=1476199 RepID=UPI000BA5789E|nr:hypothetical protein [Helicobacter sp. 12S02634-8]PAF47383.1 hypothetical protein BKH46_04705 [Helicobacter sp. 12S02634-8]